MRSPIGEPLSETHRALCTECRERSYLYRQPNGTNVALADAPGPYVIDESIAYKTTSDDGYAPHSDFCTHRHAATLIHDPADREFLWGKECGG
jgi:hypothetical protein